MAAKVFAIEKPEEFRKACGTDLIRSLSSRGRNRLFIPKWLLRTLVSGVATGGMIDLSGPSGSPKTSLVEDLSLVPESFCAILASIPNLSSNPSLRRTDFFEEGDFLAHLIRIITGIVLLAPLAYA